MSVHVLRVVGVERGAAESRDHALRHHHLDARQVLGVRASRAQALAHDLLEREAEVAAEQRVDARIDRRVAVAEPEEHREQHGRDALRTERPHHVHGEERRPAHDEPAHDDAERLGCLRFHFEALHLRFDVAPVELENRLRPVHPVALRLLLLVVAVVTFASSIARDVVVERAATEVPEVATSYKS